MLPEAVARQIISDHERRPRGRGEIAGAPHVTLDNPGCGDQVTVWVQVEEGRLAGLSFTGRGCAISQSSASLLTQTLKGKTLEEVRALAAGYRAMVMGEAPPDPVLGDLVALAGVSRLHARRKCALLAWNALDAALVEARSA
ncbi:iron-sulfur cluster assembly scaffold protein [Deinococcus aetherius]|uniref:Iron-sulfur cluster assembly scaffold protein n=1 Tax=Deinococcus aetherius TaxID=200252 RepID=A0ABM8AA56_9DEIO|nr:SUF system NifU family Fe-S cluster assembly protein [Deinococcus aetherius]BDP40641.1 iron-sulfur cluster assembly scaffold protein [Deinococcus aetherius]